MKSKDLKFIYSHLFLKIIKKVNGIDELMMIESILKLFSKISGAI